MNIATLQLASAGHQPMTASSHTSTSHTSSFADTLHATSTESVSEPSVQSNASSTDQESSNGFQLELGLGALIQKKQSAAEKDVDVAAVLNATTLTDLGVDVSSLDLVTGQQSMSLEQIAQALNVDEETLTKTLSDLVGEEVTTENLWDVLDQIDQNVYTFMQNLAAALEGKGSVSKANAANIAKLLKFVEIAAPKTDLALKQEMQVSQVKDWMSTVASRVTETVQTNQDAKKLVMQQNIQIQLSDNSAQSTTKSSATLLQSSSRFTQFQQSATEVDATSAEVLGNATTKTVPQTSVTFKLPQGTPASQAAAFVEKFEQVMNRSQMANNAQGQRLLIKLYPEELGSVRIEFIQKDGMLSARILTSTAAGKQMIESQLNQLKNGLASQNIQLDRLDIAQALSEPGRSERGQQFNQQSASQQQASDRRDEKQEDEEHYSFEELLAELEV